MSRFRTLMQREWMQHQRGWLILMCTPPLLLLLVVLFAFQVDSPLAIAVLKGPEFPHPTPMALMLGVTLVGMLLGPTITGIAVFIQSSGLARRDQQDRSIEFWLSLPVSHASSIAAPVLVHAVVIPLLALGIGWAFSQVTGLVMVHGLGGIASALELPWGAVAASSLALLLRGLLGVLLASAWLMPFFLLTLVASAWLKRWGVTVLLTSLGFGNSLLERFYGVTWIGDAARALLAGATRSFIYWQPAIWNVGADPSDLENAWRMTPSWLAEDGWHALLNLWQPWFGFAAGLSAACFALLVLHRRRAM